MNDSDTFFLGLLDPRLVQLAEGTNLGRMILRAREKAGLSLDDLGGSAGIDGRTINQIERGEIIRPPDHRLRAIALRLNLSFDRLRSTAEQDKKLGRRVIRQSKQAHN